MHWGALGGYPDRVFRILETGKRPYEFPDNVHIAVTLELDLDLQIIERQVYNILDWIGDVGGLGEGCFFISFTILGVIHFGALDNMIISELFRVDKSNDDSSKNKQQASSPFPSRHSSQVAPHSADVAAATTERDLMSPHQQTREDDMLADGGGGLLTNDKETSFDDQRFEPLQATSSLRQFIHYHLPKFCYCLCLRLNSKERIMAACRAEYLEEINIVEHIMQFREIKAQLD